MKIVYSLLVTVLLSGYAFSADSSRPTAVLGSGYYYPSKPDSGEKMFVDRLLKQQRPRIGEFRADSPYPAELEILQQDGTVVEQEELPALSLKSRKDSVSSYG